MRFLADIGIFAPPLNKLGRRGMLTNKRIARIIQSPFFDDKFYSQRYGVKGRLKGAKHYFYTGWKLGFDPSASFSTVGYLQLHPDVAAARLNPLDHYLRHGCGEGRRIAEAQKGVNGRDLPTDRGGLVPEGSKAASSEITSYSKEHCEEARALFSAEYYMSHYPDLVGSVTEPFRHFLEHGWKEHRNPSERFDTAFYLSSNPDVNNAGICPLLHFVAHGRTELRPVVPCDRLIFDLKDPPANELNFWNDGKIHIGVHAHVFFPELIGELYLALSSLPRTARVRLTTVTEGDRRYIENFVSNKRPHWSYDVQLAERSGRDIGPLFKNCVELWNSTDYMLHIHTKRSQHTTFGDAWRRYLFDQCLGSAELINEILKTFDGDGKVAMVYPENFYEIKKFVGLNGNGERLRSLCKALGYSFEVERLRDYAAGSMSWFRSSAYSELVKYLKDFDAFDAVESIEGTLAHVLERAFAAVPRAAGLTTCSYATTRRVRLDYSAVTRLLPIYTEQHNARWMRDTPRIAVNEPVALAPRVPYFNRESLNIHWVIPSFGEGAGGHMTIFRFVEFFEKCGHRQTIWIQNALNFRAPIDALRAIRQHYRPIGDRVFVRFLPACPEQLSGDVLIATDCWTAYPVASAKRFKERFYFIQDYEVEFHPAGANRLVAAQTYKFGFAGLCAGPWLLHKAKEHGMWARQWDLAADETYYFPPGQHTKQADRRPTQIAFYARTNTPRRAVELGFTAFEQLANLGYQFHVHYFGSEGDLSAQGYEATDHGIVSAEKLGELYRRCDIGVVFSATNYSLIPLEMMACALPVVELDTESVRAVFTEDELVMAQPTPPAIARSIAKLIDSSELRDRLSQNGLRTAGRYNWEQSARQVESAILERLLERGSKEIVPLQICSPNIATCRKVSVFIPVKDGGPFFEKVIDRILGQNTDFDFDFLVIDSGSTDGTLDLLKRKAKKHANFRFEEIAGRDFQHGRTRNLGISQTDGEYIAITTADALPSDELWLRRLISGFRKGKCVAGVTGRHLAYPEHGPFLARDMNASFDHFRNLGDLYSFEIPLSSMIYPGGIEWQMITQFYSDNNSAMSRAIWKLLPYPEIDFGEDMVWAWEALKLGFEKAYVDNAVVYHSHAWALRKAEDWYAIEGKFWKEFFGFDIVENPKDQLMGWNARDNIFAIQEKVSAKLLNRQLKMNHACIFGRARGAATVPN
jgi:O-antigen biosynthesis protein